MAGPRQPEMLFTAITKEKGSTVQSLHVNDCDFTTKLGSLGQVQKWFGRGYKPRPYEGEMKGAPLVGNHGAGNAVRDP
jgi:hypothetical protein